MHLRYSMYTMSVFTRAQWVYNVNKHCLLALGSLLLRLFLNGLLCNFDFNLSPLYCMYDVQLCPLPTTITN